MTDADEYDWSEDGDGVYVGECPQCHRTCPLRDLPDPYIAEIHPENDNPPGPVCGSCYHERAMDV